MAARLPGPGVLDDRRVDADDRERSAVRADRRALDHVAPPGVAQVVLELNAERAVVPEPVDAAVDIGRREHEAAALGERHDAFHAFAACGLGHPLLLPPGRRGSGTQVARFAPPVNRSVRLQGAHCGTVAACYDAPVTPPEPEATSMASATATATAAHNLSHPLRPEGDWRHAFSYHPMDVQIERAEGVFIYDTDGNRYFDASGGPMAVNLPHNHPRIKRAIAAQLENYAYTHPSIADPRRAEFCRLLAEITPGGPGPCLPRFRRIRGRRDRDQAGPPGADGLGQPGQAQDHQPPGLLPRDDAGHPRRVPQSREPGGVRAHVAEVASHPAVLRLRPAGGHEPRGVGRGMRPR